MALYEKVSLQPWCERRHSPLRCQTNVRRNTEKRREIDQKEIRVV